MIISHQFRYLFIEIPLTASWAIHHELCKNYGGEPILHKHATYPEFRQVASLAEKGYFVFATVRNPLDVVVSQYFKLKTDHRGAFSNPKSARDFLVDFSDFNKYRFVQEKEATFANFFVAYYRRPYSNLIDYSANDLDFVIRFEHLQEDFTQVLRQLNLEQVRSIPSSNKTSGKKGRWQDYYTPEIIDQARRVFGPFMERWDYNFPHEWGPLQVTQWDKFKYNTFNLMRGLYVNHFKYKHSIPARLVRSLRAAFK